MPAPTATSEATRELPVSTAPRLFLALYRSLQDEHRPPALPHPGVQLIRGTRQ